MRKALLGIALLLVVLGCVKDKACREGTVTVTFDFADGPDQVDGVAMRYQLDDGPAADMKALARPAGASQGTLVLEVSNYSIRKQLLLQYAPQKAKQIVGVWKDHVVALGTGCTAIELTVAIGADDGIVVGAVEPTDAQAFGALDSGQLDASAVDFALRAEVAEDEVGPDSANDAGPDAPKDAAETDVPLVGPLMGPDAFDLPDSVVSVDVSTGGGLDTALDGQIEGGLSLDASVAEGGDPCSGKTCSGAVSDSCCPSGCNQVSDTDCTPICGNGVKESGENCDPLTSCPAACPMVGCMKRRLDAPGTCQTACVDDGRETACRDNDGCCPSGCNNTTDNDCPISPKAPGATCSGNGECSSDMCTDGRCCVQTCSACQECTGPGGTCVNIAMYSEDNNPAGICVGSNSCDGSGNCRRDNGQACGGDATLCASGICTQGVCCNSACTQACSSCTLSGKVGACSTIDFSADPNNCGGCGVVCSGNHVAVVCSSGKCTGACEQGWKDCNSNKQTDGCEVNTDADPQNCGGCGMPCSANNATPACTGGSCTSTCLDADLTPPVFADCNGDLRTDGCETNLYNYKNCGQCGNACPNTVNSMGCYVGVCRTCDYSSSNNANRHKNCDLDLSTGCEIDTWTDPNNCGGCGNVCPAGQSCQGGLPGSVCY